MQYDEIPVGYEIPGLQIPVTREMISNFAVASLDHNPLHWDDNYVQNTEFAGGTRFNGIIGHGLMTYSFMSRLMTDWLWPDVGSHRRVETRFERPVYPGDEIKVSAEVTGKHSTRKGKWLEIELAVRNQRGETVATGSALAEIFR